MSISPYEKASSLTDTIQNQYATPNFVRRFEMQMYNYKRVLGTSDSELIGVPTNMRNPPMV